MKHDLCVWQTFSSSFNGKSFFLNEHWRNNDNLNLYTDASGTIGFGALFGCDWCYGAWPDCDSSPHNFNLNHIIAFNIQATLLCFSRYQQQSQQHVLYVTALQSSAKAEPLSLRWRSHYPPKLNYITRTLKTIILTVQPNSSTQQFII